MASLIEAARTPSYPADVRLVISNRPGAGGLAIAQAAGIETLVVDHKSYPDRGSFDAVLDEALRSRDIDLVCLAGFMRVLTTPFVESWSGRMLNIHPSLLPLFRGVDTHAQALEAGVLLHGCSVHFVVPELDAGPIVAQAAVPVHPGDTVDALAARVLAQEHRLYPLGLDLVARGLARLEAGRIEFSPAVRWGDGALATPEGA